ncbi:MAG: hypothetical protein JNG90_01865 [Planctomycetaceae bacterium]|nr:hypothetical protein [Planctomycetaceae bacterium]
MHVDNPYAATAAQTIASRHHAPRQTLRQPLSRTMLGVMRIPWIGLAGAVYGLLLALSGNGDVSECFGLGVVGFIVAFVTAVPIAIPLAWLSRGRWVGLLAGLFSGVFSTAFLFGELHPERVVVPGAIGLVLGGLGELAIDFYLRRDGIWSRERIDGTGLSGVD